MRTYGRRSTAPQVPAPSVGLGLAHVASDGIPGQHPLAARSHSSSDKDESLFGCSLAVNTSQRTAPVIERSPNSCDASGANELDHTLTDAGAGLHADSKHSSLSMGGSAQTIFVSPSSTTNSLLSPVERTASVVAAATPWWKRSSISMAPVSTGSSRQRVGEDGEPTTRTLSGGKRPLTNGLTARPPAKLARVSPSSSAPPATGSRIDVHDDGTHTRDGDGLGPAVDGTTTTARPTQSGARVQTYLDVGQRSVDTRTCAACGMVWAPGLREDERAHTAHCGSAASMHLAYAAGGNDTVVAHVTLEGSNAPARIVKLPSGEGPTAASSSSASSNSIGSNSRRGRAWEVRSLLHRVLGEASDPERGAAPAAPTAHRTHIKKAAVADAGGPTDVCDAADEGEDTGGGRSLGEAGEGGGAAASSVTSTAPREVVRWLCVAGGRVAGVAVTQRITTAYPAVVVVGGAAGAGATERQRHDGDATSGSSIATGNEGNSGGGSSTAVTNTTASSSIAGGTHGEYGAGGATGTEGRQLTVDLTSPRPALLGVAQIWVHPDYRRSGVATALLDAARGHAVYAYRVPSERLAFSAPTRAGEALARAYLAASASSEQSSGGGKVPDLLVYN